MTSLLKYGVLLTPKYGQKCKFQRVTQNLRGFAYVVRDYKSAAEATSLLSSIASLAISNMYTGRSRSANAGITGGLHNHFKIHIYLTNSDLTLVQFCLLYSGTCNLGTPSGPWQMSPEQGLGWNLFYSCLGICFSRFFKELDNVSTFMTNLSPRYRLLNSDTCSTVT